MRPEEARAFVASNHRAVLVTRRRGGGLQTSPVLVGVDDDGKVVISTREGAYKTRNLRRDPTAVLCVLSDDLLHGQQVDPQGPDPGYDRVQVDLVGLFPAGAGDVPGPNAQARHRGSMAEPLPPDQREGGPRAGGLLVPVEDRLRPDKARAVRLEHAGR